MKAIRIWLVLVAITAGNFLFAQTAGTAPQQLVELVKKAFDNYPKLKEGAEYVKLSEAQRDLARGVYMPIIEGVASYRYGKPTPSITIPLGTSPVDISFIPANNYDFHIGITQPIWDFGHSRANVQRTISDIQTNKDNLEGNKQLLAYQVAQLYYAIVFLNKSMDVQNEQIKLLKENEKIIGDRVKDGDALKLDLLNTQVKRNNAENQLIDLQANLQKQYELLNMLTGAEGEGYITQKDVNAGEVVNSEVNADNNYDVIVLNDKLKSSDWEIKHQKRGWLPTLIAQGKFGAQNGWVPDINKILGTYSVGVGLNVPIFSSARPNYLTKIAKINAQALKYNLDAQKLTINKDVLQAKSDLTANSSKLKNYELQIEQAKEALNLANIRYRSGVITNLEQLTAQTNLQEAELGQIQLEYNVLLNKLQLNKLGGAKFW